MKNRKTIGLALGSGAYRGFAHIGVIRSFEKNNIPIDFLSGASIGAWAAAYYAFSKDISNLEKDLIDNQKENISLLFDFGWTAGLISGEKFADYLAKKLHSCQFSNLQIPLRIVATNLADGRPYVFSEGDVATAVRASCSVPLVFKALRLEDKFLVDGGLSNPVPNDLVRDLGADIVIGVNLYNKNEFQKIKYTESNIVVRSTMVMLASLADAAAAKSDLTIEPDTSALARESSLSKYFSKQTADALIKIGEEAADRAMPAIKRLLV